MSKPPQAEHPIGDPCAFPELCPLNQVDAGSSVTIKRLEASAELCHRLREMGLGEDQHVRVVRSDESVICQVCHARLGLSPELAGRILVEPPAQRRGGGRKAA